MPRRLTARDIMDKLVSFPTVSRDSNLDLIDWVEDYLDGHGVRATRVWDAGRDKASLYANVGPQVEGGIVLSGHTDVVPVDGQDWTSDPFTVTERNGRLYGRGTCDMKGFDALALAAVPLALERGVKRPLQIALSYDEEVGCTGAPPMIDEMVAHLPRAAAAIIGEPSTMQVVTGHKGGAGYRVRMRGFEVHSSIMHQGVSAVMEAARLIDWANRMNAENRAAAPGPLAADFDPPWTTLHVGMVQGGTAHNITAKDCEFLLSWRVVPGESSEDWGARFLAEVARIEAEMKAVRPEAGIDLEKYFDVPALAQEDAGEAERLTRMLTGDNGTHAVSYATEAGQFQARGYSAVVCGPGDIAQAHQPDEYIEAAQLAAGEAFMERLVDHLCR
ncbi:acetylornithine deacetylase [Rhodobacteraceae bacterium CCMM004]|nr:acetylornithine deacetylase [Rhodobacteraceae bacterium CCMM004]